MKVSELIEMLKELPQDAIVKAENGLVIDDYCLDDDDNPILMTN